MNLPVSIRPEAEADILDAFQWYEAQSPGVGIDFLRCLESSLAAIGSMAQMYGIVFRTIRRALVRRFPYAVFYVYDKKRITVIAVMHASRHPRRWQSRSK